MADPTTAGADAVAASGGGGLPQFQMAPWPGEIIWALVIFGILYLLIWRVFLPRVAGTIDAREDKIAGDVGDATRARDAARAELEAAAGELAQARTVAQKLALDAKEEAKALAAGRRAEEEARLATVLAAADARIAAAQSEAMTHVRGIALDAAQAMIAHLTGTEVSAAEVEQAMVATPAA
jgi:F-type H+-transporting ATPase subunit b